MGRREAPVRRRHASGRLSGSRLARESVRAALFLGRNGSQGVGCDDSEGPSRQLHPDVKVVPSATADYVEEYPWLAFRGRWGELQPAFYNGPTGPNMKRQWTEPIRWSEDSWRGESFVVPVGGSFGPNATDYFCTAVAKGSALLTKLIRSPGTVILVLAVLIALILLAAQRTSWSQASPLRLARRRAWGEIVNSARRMLRSSLACSSASASSSSRSGS